MFLHRVQTTETLPHTPFRPQPDAFDVSTVKPAGVVGVFSQSDEALEEKIRPVWRV